MSSSISSPHLNFHKIFSILKNPYNFIKDFSSMPSLSLAWTLIAQLFLKSFKSFITLFKIFFFHICILLTFLLYLVIYSFESMQVHCCYFVALVLIYFCLAKCRDTFFRPETNLGSFFYVMVLIFIKLYS